MTGLTSRMNPSSSESVRIGCDQTTRFLAAKGSGVVLYALAQVGNAA